MDFFFKLLWNTRAKKMQFEYFAIDNTFQTLLANLKTFHFIHGYKIDNKIKKVTVFLTYDKQGNSILQNLILVSKPSQRRTISLSGIKAFLLNYPLSLGLVRTPHGILSFQQCQKHKCGGEFLVLLV
jgi:ribosomal protein S8